VNSLKSLSGPGAFSGVGTWGPSSVPPTSYGGMSTIQLEEHLRLIQEALGSQSTREAQADISYKNIEAKQRASVAASSGIKLPSQTFGGSAGLSSFSGVVQPVAPLSLRPSTVSQGGAKSSPYSGYGGPAPWSPGVGPSSSKSKPVDGFTKMAMSMSLSDDHDSLVKVRCLLFRIMSDADVILLDQFRISTNA